MSSRRSSLAVLVLLALLPGSACAQRSTTRVAPAATPSLQGRPITFEDFATMPVVSDPQLSPDGKSIAYIGGGQLWVADASGGAKRQLTTINGGASGPVWAPTSDRIAFTSGVYRVVFAR